MLLYKHSFGPRISLSQCNFYEILVKELIKNKFDSISRRLSNCGGDKEDDTLLDPVEGSGTSMAVTNKRRKLGNGDYTSASCQGRCLVSKVRKLKFLFSTCRENGLGNIDFCHESTKRCFLMYY